VSADEAAEPPADEACRPCRGSGTVISNLGGTPSEVACPWCEGTGRQTTGRDAQARWREQPAS
jgi:DnaJ-class molecular chaperone